MIRPLTGVVTAYVDIGEGGGSSADGETTTVLE